MTTGSLLEFTRILNRDRILGLAGVGTLFFNSLDDVFTFQDLAKDNVASVQPGGLQTRAR